MWWTKMKHCGWLVAKDYHIMQSIVYLGWNLFLKNSLKSSTSNSSSENSLGFLLGTLGVEVEGVQGSVCLKVSRSCRDNRVQMINFGNYTYSTQLGTELKNLFTQDWTFKDIQTVLSWSLVWNKTQAHEMTYTWRSLKEMHLKEWRKIYVKRFHHQ
jgi:hypothetical protein